MTGRLAIVGIGPGAAGHVTPLATETLAIATDLVGYGPYLSRVPKVPDRHVMSPTTAKAGPRP